MIYLITCVGTPFAKIGTTKNVKSRLSVLQTGCPFPLRVLVEAESSVCDDTDAEMLLHAGFAPRRVSHPYVPDVERRRQNSEWFNMAGLSVDMVLSAFSIIDDLFLFSLNEKNFFGPFPGWISRALESDADKKEHQYGHGAAVLAVRDAIIEQSATRQGCRN